MKLKFKRTTTISLLCASLLGGLFLAKLTDPLSFSWIIPFLIFVIAFRKSKSLNIIFLVLLFLLLGWWRGGILQEQNIKYQQFYGQKVTVAGIAQEDAFYSINSQLEFNVSSVYINGEQMPGKIRVRGFGEPAVYRYDRVEVTGKLYPSAGSRQASISYADINVTATTNGWLDDLRRDFIVGMETALPEPAASFGIGILVGQRSLLPEDLLLALTTVGLVHIVAVSGYNLTIIVDFIKRASQRLSRFQVLALACFLMYGFILVTGFSPSIVRASIISFLSLTAWYFGRQFKPVLLILFTAALTAMFNPYYVWGDIGWYLSFLAFAGILILAPAIVKLFKRRSLPILVTVAIETFSAQIMTAPLIMMVFAKFSLASFLANVIVVPLIPFAMLFSFLAGLAGMIVPQIAAWLAIPARLLLNFIILVAEWFARLPAAQKNIALSGISMIFFYLIIFVYFLALNKRTRSVKIELKEQL